MRVLGMYGHVFSSTPERILEIFKVKFMRSGG
jgi:hypothetical protein